MESILGLSARYVPPATAREKLKHITEDREKLDEQFKQKIDVSTKAWVECCNCPLQLKIGLLGHNSLNIKR